MRGSATSSQPHTAVMLAVPRRVRAPSKCVSVRKDIPSADLRAPIWNQDIVRVCKASTEEPDVEARRWARSFHDTSCIYRRGENTKELKYTALMGCKLRRGSDMHSNHQDDNRDLTYYPVVEVRVPPRCAALRFSVKKSDMMKGVEITSHPIVFEYAVGAADPKTKGVQALAYVNNGLGGEFMSALYVTIYCCTTEAAILFHVSAATAVLGEGDTFWYGRIFEGGVDEGTIDSLARLYMMMQCFVRIAGERVAAGLDDARDALPRVESLQAVDRVAMHRVAMQGDMVYKWYWGEGPSSEDSKWKTSSEVVRQPTYFSAYMPSSALVKIFCINARLRRKLLEYRRIEGEHDLFFVRQATGLLQLLQRMHNDSVVHGDIRLANIVAHKDNPTQAQLIDFDYSGKHDEDVYPEGWNDAIDDGQRHAGARGGQVMRKEHDWYSIAELLDYFFESEEEGNRQTWVDLVAKLKNEGVAEMLESALEVQNFALRMKHGRRPSWLGKCNTGSPIAARGAEQ